ncbi:hypothetical protein IQ247_17065 [Plectonema cf. radiosum LEGE 06105]|uniref:Uncharacterized protein n=1 Tax=Plectonema cf. radiosum LEGE 06105 TaxID=945769 RepID=A0A8J7F8Y7_9CYAN|nr:hypothetical protein [Plectonema radiosum]MBE9214359.1 hypothetical protein [Plectonema cf. radiosum LEGE 06105]
MKTKVFGFALLLGLATIIGACEGGGDTPSTTDTPPAAGEPVDAPGTVPEATPTATP